LGERGVEITENIIGFVENMKVGVLGSLGFAMLFYTVISLMQKIERAFNKAWRVTRERSLGQKFRDYLSVLVIGPALVFSAIGITATVMSAPVIEDMHTIAPLSEALKIAGRLVPFFMIVAAFTFLYAFIPNTKVRIGPALAGGLVSGVLWNGAGWLFASFVVGSANYTAVYSAFATLLFFMIWLYIGWLILLTGASIAFYTQNPAYAGAARPAGISHRARETLALSVLALISHSFYRDHEAWTLDRLCGRLHQRSDVIDGVLTALENAGLIKSTSDTPPSFLPGRPFEEATAKDALVAIRSDGDDVDLADTEPGSRMTGLVDDAEAQAAAVLSAVNLKELGSLPPGSDAAEQPQSG
jgi:membrane protein